MKYSTHNVINGKLVDEQQVTILVCRFRQNKIGVILDYGVGATRHIHDIQYREDGELDGLSHGLISEPMHDNQINHKAQQVITYKNVCESYEIITTKKDSLKNLLSYCLPYGSFTLGAQLPNFRKELEALLHPPVVNKELVNDFNEALKRLESLHTSLETKYGKSKSKQYIVQNNETLIQVLKSALTNYEKNGDRNSFKATCEQAINEKVRAIYNTHRDGAVKQFFATIADAFSNLWAKLFASKEEYKARNETKNVISKFFQSNDRITRSANELHQFNTQIEKAFTSIGVAIPEVNETMQKQCNHG